MPHSALMAECDMRARFRGEDDPHVALGRSARGRQPRYSYNPYNPYKDYKDYKNYKNYKD